MSILSRRNPKAPSEPFRPGKAAQDTALNNGMNNGLPYRGIDRNAPARQIMGDSGSTEALRILAEANEHIRRLDMLNLLRDALQKFNKGEWAAGGELARQALLIDEHCAEAWHVLGVACDKCDRFTTALACYEAALKLQPDNVSISSDLGRLAYRMGITDMAEKFFRYHLEKCPDNIEAINNLATTLREASKSDEAIALLQAYIPRHPREPQLWNALGTVMNAIGDMENAKLFYRETLRFDPTHVHATYNLGNCLVGEEAIELLERALPLFKDPANIQTCKLSLAFANLGVGRLTKGWEWYAARTRHAGNDTVYYVIQKPRWQPGEAVAGKRLFISAEQGLGDEILFANILRNLRDDIGEGGALSVGIEPRLAPLFRRSFPDIDFQRHHTTRHENRTVRLFPDVTDWEQYDAWTIMGDFLGRYRDRIEDFPEAPGFLTPDPERVAYWRQVLAELNGKPKIGLLWKSLIKHARRDRYYSPFEDWKPVLELQGAQFINLQYGDTAEEIEAAARAGIDIWTPPGIDLKNDLDDLAALCVAVDVIVSPSVATSNIAGACGVPVFLMMPEHGWTALGTDRYPWYPNTRVFFTRSLSDWLPVMNAIADALIETHGLQRPGSQGLAPHRNSA